MWFKYNLSFWLSSVLLCSSVLCSDVFVKIDDNLEPLGSCLDAKAALTVIKVQLNKNKNFGPYFEYLWAL